MQKHYFFFFLFLFSATLIPLSLGHNITQILSNHPDFSTFNHYLSATHLADEINRRKTITVLAVDNSAMSSILSKHFTLQTLKNLLSLHVLVDYFGANKLHQITGGTALSSTLFQSSGLALGMAGFVNITDHRGGKVTFCAHGSDAPVSFLKSLKEIPYTISVLQITTPLSSDTAEAPTAAPTQIDIISLMSKKGCKNFAGLLNGSSAGKTFEDSVAAGGGITILCPIDQAMAAFMPKFNRLTAADKLSVLLYHGIPFYESLDMLRAHNGIVSTLATSPKSRNYHITVKNEGAAVVTLVTKVTKAKITGTLVDEDPLALFTIDQVLEPKELFKPVVRAPAPAPAPSPSALAPVADAPKGPKSKKKKKEKKEKKKKTDTVPAPAPAGPDSAPADDDTAAADLSAVGRVSLGHWYLPVTAIVGAMLVLT